MFILLQYTRVLVLYGNYILMYISPIKLRADEVWLLQAGVVIFTAFILGKCLV